MPITIRDFPLIVESLRNSIYTNIPELDTSEGTLTRISLIDPFSTEVEKIEQLMLDVQASQYILTAQGQDLDLLAFNYNVQRRGAQRASGFAQVYVEQTSLTTPITIPEGTIIRSANNTLYETLVETVLNGFSQSSTRNSVAVYEVSIPIQATSTGSTGNAASNKLVTIDGFTELNVTNDAPIEGGYESETDESLAARCILSFGAWSRGTKQAVEFGARTVSGVYYATAVYAYAGHFNLYVADQAGLLSDDMETAVDAAMVEWASAGVGWTILQPPLYLLNSTFKVSFKSSANIPTQTNTFKADVATIINQTVGSAIYIDDLYSALKTRTASYVNHFDMDTPNEHVAQTTGTIIRSGVVTVTVV